MSKDDQIAMNNPVDHVEEEFSQTVDTTDEQASDIINDDTSDTPPNLDDIRLAGF